jgi:TRAP-type C4-dicarboxylate transport system permease small subunit
VRLYAVHGLAAGIAFAAVPFAMMIWATASLRKLIRSAEGTGFVNG